MNSYLGFLHRVFFFWGGGGTNQNGFSQHLKKNPPQYNNILTNFNKLKITEMYQMVRNNWQKHRFGVVSDMLLLLYNYAYMHSKNLKISTVSLKKKSCNIISF